MTKYRAIQSFPLPHPANPKRQILVRGGEEVELADDQVAEHAFGVSIERLDEDKSDELPEEVELPQRPPTGGTKEAWRVYLAELDRVTTEGGLEPMVIPEDVTRDQMVALGDARVQEWEEG